MKKITLLLILPFIQSVALSQIPPKPVIHGNDTICRGGSNAIFYIDQVPDTDTTIWTTDIPFGSIYVLSKDTIKLFTTSNSTTAGYVIAKLKKGANYGDTARFLVDPIIQPDPPTSPPSGKETVCTGEENVKYTTLPIVNATGYTWTVPSWVEIKSTTDGGKTIYVNISANVAGNTYGYISVQGNNGDCLGEPSSLQIHAKAQSEIKLSLYTPASTCLNTEHRLVAAPDVVGNDTTFNYYTWHIGPDSVSNNGSRFLFWIASDTLINTISCSLKHKYQCYTPNPVEKTNSINIASHSVPGVIGTNKKSLCVSQTLSLSLKNYHGVITSWLGYRNDSLFMVDKSQNSTLEKSGLTVGKYLFVANVRNGTCDSVSAFSDTITVIAGPALGISGGDTLVQKGGINYHDKANTVFLICTECVLADQQLKKYKYHWGYCRNDQTIVGADPALDGLQYYLFQKDSTIRYYFLDISSKSESDSCTIRATINSNRLFPDISSPFKIQPNPNNGFFTLEFISEYFGTVTIRILDLIGNEHHQQTIYKYHRYLRIPYQLNTLNKGPYLIETRLGNGERFIDKVFIY